MQTQPLQYKPLNNICKQATVPASVILLSENSNLELLFRCGLLLQHPTARICIVLIEEYCLIFQCCCWCVQDVTVHASRPFSANSVIGVYRSLTMLPSEELVLRHNPPAQYSHSTVNWRQALDAYAAGMKGIMLCLLDTLLSGGLHYRHQ